MTVERRPDAVKRQNVNLPAAVAVIGDVLLGAAVAWFDGYGEAVKLGIAHLFIGEGETIEQGEDCEILQRLLPSALQVEPAR